MLWQGENLQAHPDLLLLQILQPPGLWWFPLRVPLHKRQERAVGTFSLAEDMCKLDVTQWSSERLKAGGSGAKGKITFISRGMEDEGCRKQLRKTQGLAFPSSQIFLLAWWHGPPMSQHGAEAWSPLVFQGLGQCRMGAGSLAWGFFQVEIMRNRSSNKNNPSRFWAASRALLCNLPGSGHPLQTWPDWVRPSRGAQRHVHRISPTEPKAQE